MQLFVGFSHFSSTHTQKLLENTNLKILICIGKTAFNEGDSLKDPPCNLFLEARLPYLHEIFWCHYTKPAYLTRKSTSLPL